MVPVIKSGVNPGSTQVCGMGRPDADGCICIVRLSPDGPTDLGCGSSDSMGMFCITVPPLQQGWIIVVEDRCPPFQNDPLTGQPQFVGMTPAPTLQPIGLAIGLVLLGFVGLLGVRRLRAWTAR